VTSGSPDPPEADPLAGLLAGLRNLPAEPDLGMLSSAAEMVRQYSQVPDGDFHPAMAELMTALAELSAGIASGQRKPEHRQALASLCDQIAELEATGQTVYPGISAAARLFSSVRRADGCLLAIGNQPSDQANVEQPGLTDLDAAVADLEAAVASFPGGAPILEMLSAEARLRIVQLRLVRARLTARDTPARDQSWLDEALRSLRRAQHHLADVPAKLAGQAEQLRTAVEADVAVLVRAGATERSTAPSDTASAAAGGAPASTAGRSAQSAGQPRPERPAGPAGAPDRPSAGTPEPTAAPQSAGPVIPTAENARTLRKVLPALQLLLSALPGEHPAHAAIQALVAGGGMLDSLITGRWTPGQDQALAGLRQLISDEEEKSDEAAGADLPRLRGVLAWAESIRSATLARSPRAADWPSVPDVTRVVAQLEEAIAAVPAEDAALMHSMAAIHLQWLAVENARGQVGGSIGEACRRLLERALEHMEQIPPELAGMAGNEAAAHVAQIKQLLSAGQPADHPPQGSASRLSSEPDGSFEAGAATVNQVVERARQVMLTSDPEQLTPVIADLRALGRGLPPGHPSQAIVLGHLADLLARRAALPGAPAEDMADALTTAVAAVRVAPPEAAVALSGVLVQHLGRIMLMDQRTGPFEQAEAALSEALGRAGAGNAALGRVVAVGIAMARGLQARGSADEQLRARAEAAFAAAENSLREPEPSLEWAATAWLLTACLASQAMASSDPRIGAMAVRMSTRMERFLLANPALADSMGSQFGPSPFLSSGQGSHQMLRVLRGLREMVSLITGDTTVAATLRANPMLARSMFAAAGQSRVLPMDEEGRRLARRGLDHAADVLGTGQSRGRPVRADPPGAHQLRLACGELHAALAAGLADNDLRQRVNATLGTCLAELYWMREPADAPRGTGPGAVPAASESDAPGGREAALDRTLTDAITHLDTVLTGTEHSLPSLGRVELLGLLARCFRETAQRGLRDDGGPDAERTIRAALRELARCVLVAERTDEALAAAARADQIVPSGVEWGLADGRTDAAVEIAEAGRSLVLASVALSGQVEAVLRGAGNDSAAAAWRRGDTDGRLAGLDALWDTRFGQSMLSAPVARHISAMLFATGELDAVVYLVPPGTAGSAAHALLLRPGLSDQIETLPLPGVQVGSDSPPGRYRAAFDAALAGCDPRQRHPDGFRGSPAGLAWAAELDALGRWAHDHLTGPLAEHVRGWSLGRTPHLALVPLGDLAAVPYAAAWTPEAEAPGGRRYAIHDLILTQAASGRLHGEVLRRPRRPLAEEVTILVPDPAAEFPYARATAAALVSHLYPDAQACGRRMADGQATTARFLAALPDRDRPGASLVHLATHATSVPTARLQTADGWLPLSSILAQGRERSPDSPGGLVVTSACLTDSTHSQYDESLTLATALLAAGASGVIGTRWPVEDDTAATLAYHLHHHLASGHSPAQALRIAQLDMIDPSSPPRPGLHPHLAHMPAARRAHPASWAGYTYHGR
jgi:hypothetical protein